jgi:hypothetical protein
VDDAGMKPVTNKVTHASDFAYIEVDIPAGMTIAAFRRERAESSGGPTRRARLRKALSAQPRRPSGHVALWARVA